MKPPLSRRHAWIVSLVLILLVGLAGQLTSAWAQGPTRAQQDNALYATMRVWTLDASNKIIAGCSGTVVDPAGYVLTNFHCVGVTSGDTQAQAQPGTFYNPQGLLALGPTTDPRKAPKPTYMAKFIVGNYDLDVAVLKIIGMVNSNERLPNPLPLVVEPRADSDAVNIGDYVAAFGYPSVGGNTITFTPGQIAGFDDMNGDGTPDSFKVTANINPGNSGGLAINDKGEQIGIPTWSLYNAQTGSKLDRVLMVNVAEPYIRKALSISAISGEVTGPPDTKPPINPPSVNPPVGKATPGTPPIASQPTFGSIQFGADYQNGQLIRPGNTFASGTSNVAGMFQYSGMKPGMDWGRVWLLDGQIIAGKQTGYAWSNSMSGTTAASLTGPDKGPLPDGNYKLVLYINNAVASQGDLTIGRSGPPPPVAPTPSSQSGVILKGQVIDADTQRGIAEALFLILKPGVSMDEFNQAFEAGSIDNLIAAVATTDKSGNYATSPAIARRKVYSVIVAASGYQARVFENGLEITDKDPAITTMKSIALRRQ